MFHESVSRQLVDVNRDLVARVDQVLIWARALRDTVKQAQEIIGPTAEIAPRWHVFSQLDQALNELDATLNKHRPNHV